MRDAWSQAVRVHCTASECSLLSSLLLPCLASAADVVTQLSLTQISFALGQGMEGFRLMRSCLSCLVGVAHALVQLQPSVFSMSAYSDTNDALCSAERQECRDLVLVAVKQQVLH